MAFRNHKFSYSCPPPQDVYDEVISTTMVDDVEVPSVVSVTNSDFTKDLPNLSDYKLSDLLQAGVPLSPVNPKVLGTAEDKLNNIVDDVINNTPTPAPAPDNDNNAPDNDNNNDNL